MTNAATANVIALRVLRDALLVSVAFFSEINIRQAQVPGRIRMLSDGTHALSIPAISIIPDAVIRQPTVLAKVARFVTPSFSFNVVCPFPALAGIGPAFRIQTQHILALIIVLAVVSDGRCKSDAFTRKVLGEYKVTLKAGTNAKSGRWIGMFTVSVRWTLRVDPAHAGGTSDESLTSCPGDNGTDDKEDQLQHNQ